MKAIRDKITKQFVVAWGCTPSGDEVRPTHEPSPGEGQEVIEIPGLTHEEFIARCRSMAGGDFASAVVEPSGIQSVEAATQPPYSLLAEELSKMYESGNKRPGDAVTFADIAAAELRSGARVGEEITRRTEPVLEQRRPNVQ